MKRMNILRAMVFGAAWIVGIAGAQAQAIQPSPAYYQGGVGSYPAPATPAPSVAPAAEPVYWESPEPVPPLRLAPAVPAAEYEEEDEEGLYWFWGQKWPGLALGPKFGTTGIGADLVFGINRFLNLRSGFNFGSFTWDLNLGEVDYEMDITMTSIPLLLDIHPFGNHFRITGGFYIQPGTEADIDATPTGNTQIGAHTYPSDVIGTLTGNIEVSDIFAPYLGIGFGNAVAEDQLLTFMVDFGVIIQAYDVSLTSDGAGMTTLLDTFREDLAREEANIQKDMESFNIYPVLTVGIAWHF